MDLATMTAGVPGFLIPLRVALFAASDEGADQAETPSESTSATEDGPAVQPPVRVRVLGTFCALDAQGNRIDLGRVPGGVLKLVAVRRTVPLDEVVESVWPDVDLRTGRRRLRNVLNRIRSTCGDVVRREGEMLQLVEAVEVDAHRFEINAQRALDIGPSPEGAALAGRAVAIYRGDLLPADRFRDWTGAPRERLRKRFVALLDLMSRAAADRADAEEVVSLLERAIELEPYDEHRYLLAARVWSEDGRQGAASMMLRRASAMLDELGVTPSAHFRTFERALREGGPLPPPGGGRHGG